MRWVGQHIYDLIAKFRADLEVGDPDGGTGFTIDSDSLVGVSSVSSKPLIQFTNTNTDNAPISVNFFKTSASPADDDRIAQFNYYVNNDNDDAVILGMSRWSIADVTDGSESGKYEMSMQAGGGSSAGQYNFFKAEGVSSDVVDVTIGLGSASSSRVTGDLTISGGDLYLMGTGRIQGVDTVSASTDAANKAYVDAAQAAAIAATVGASVDLTSEVTGTLPVANGGTGATSLADNSILTGTGTSAITAEAALTWDGSMLTVFSEDDANEPVIRIHQTEDAVPTTGGELRFDTDRGSTAVGNNDDILGTITWRGHDNQTGGNAAEEIYASIVGLIQSPENSGTSEDGKLELKVTNQSVLNTGLALSSVGVNGHVNATIGKGAAGLVTIEGYLSLGGHSVNDIDIASESSDDDGHLMTALAIKNRIEDYNYVTAAATLTTAAQTNITSLGTLTNLDVDNVNVNGDSIVMTPSSGDTFTIASATNGATTLTTVDTAGSDADLSLVADGNLNLSFLGTVGGSTAEGLYLQASGTTMADFKHHHGATWLMMYEDGGASAVDYFAIEVKAQGDTVLRTFDGAATAAHFEVVADGDITLNSAGQIKLEPAAGNNILLDGVLTVDGGVVVPLPTAHNVAGTDIYIEAGTTTAGTTNNIAGGGLYLQGGQGKGSGAGGDILFRVADAGSSGSTLNALATKGKVTSAGFEGNLSGTVTQAAQTNITSLGTLTALDVDNININGDTITASGDMALVATGNDITVDTDNFIISSATASAPVITLEATHTHSGRGGELKFVKDADDTQDGEALGYITWYGEDDAGNTQQFIKIKGEIEESGSGTEGGKLTMLVASHTGAETAGLIIEDGSASGEVDVTIAAGAASMTSVAGSLDIATALRLDSAIIDTIQIGAESHVDNDTSLMTSAAVKDLVDAGGGGSGGGKQTFSFHKRVTVNSSTAKWVAGYAENWYMSAEVYSLATTKSGSNYTDTTASNWATFNYRQFTVAHACTIDSFVCSAYQNNCDADITVGIWKHGAQATIANHSAADAVMDFIGEITFTADADTNSMHASQTLTSFESGTDLAAGDGVILAVARTGGGTDGSYWYIHGGVGVTYD